MDTTTMDSGLTTIAKGKELTIGPIRVSTLDHGAKAREAAKAK